MRDIVSAMNEEQKYLESKLNGINITLLPLISPHGYTSLSEYFHDKREYLFSQWIPEIIYINVKTLTTELEKAIKEEKYGIYISTSDTLYAFHGTDDIDYILCDELGVEVAELYHQGGTIIGSNEDLGIEIVAPIDIGLDSNYILSKLYEIISNYVDDVIMSGNDILVGGKKVLGSMRRTVGDVFVWAAQVSFKDYSEIISQVCNKKSTKEPGYIDSKLLSRDKLEEEVIKWLRKQ